MAERLSPCVGGACSCRVGVNGDRRQIGNAVAVSRAALIERLEMTSAGDRFQWVIRKRSRVVDSLETLRKHAAAAPVRVPAPANARDRLFANLSPEIILHSGDLHIHFANAEDLAAKLFELSQALANDWLTFETVLI